MNRVTNFALLAVVLLGFWLLNVAKAEDAKAGPMTGTLIDNHCGEKKADEAAAGSHKSACATKDACAASGYQLIVGDKHYKLDDKGNEQAKAYLTSSENTKVIIDGTLDGETLKVNSIKPAEKEGDKKDAK